MSPLKVTGYQDPPSQTSLQVSLAPIYKLPILCRLLYYLVVKFWASIKLVDPQAPHVIVYAIPWVPFELVQFLLHIGGFL